MCLATQNRQRRQVACGGGAHEAHAFGRSEKARVGTRRAAGPALEVPEIERLHISGIFLDGAKGVLMVWA